LETLGLERRAEQFEKLGGLIQQFLFPDRIVEVDDKGLFAGGASLQAVKFRLGPEDGSCC
jgi:hypothetical protein